MGLLNLIKQCSKIALKIFNIKYTIQPSLFGGWMLSIDTIWPRSNGSKCSYQPNWKFKNPFDLRNEGWIKKCLVATLVIIGPRSNLIKKKYGCNLHSAGQMVSIDTMRSNKVEYDRSTKFDRSTALEFDTNGVILGKPLTTLE